MTRNPAYDIMRMVAILLVATQHAWSMLGMDRPEFGMLCHAYRALVDCGVPLFVAISGALLLNEAPQPLSVFFKKRMSRVMIPFLIWATVVYVVSILTKQYAEIATWSDALRCYLPYLLSNRINTFHWFVWMILALYLLTPLLQRMLQAQDSRRIVEYCLAVIAAVLLAEWLYPDLYILRFSSQLLAYLGVYLGGYYIARYVSDKQCAWAALGCISVGLCLIPGAPTPILTKLTALAMFAALKPLHVVKQEAACTKIAVAISRYSYLIYLIHIPIIRAILMACTHIGVQPAYLYSNAATPICISLCAVGLTALFCFAANRLLPRSINRILGIA